MVFWETFGIILSTKWGIKQAPPPKKNKRNKETESGLYKIKFSKHWNNILWTSSHTDIKYF